MQCTTYMFLNHRRVKANLNAASMNTPSHGLQNPPADREHPDDDLHPQDTTGYLTPVSVTADQNIMLQETYTITPRAQRAADSSNEYMYVTTPPPANDYEQVDGPMWDEESRDTDRAVDANTYAHADNKPLPLVVYDRRQTQQSLPH